MSSFTKPLRYEDLGGKKIKLIEEFEFYYTDEDKTIIIQVPMGFICDGASIPRLFWTLIGHPFGEYGKSAVIHDYLYRIGGLTRKKSDIIFLVGMEVLKVKRWKRKIMYRFVRALGWVSWRRYRRANRG